MEKSLKGALLSGLVFPGLGQIALKHYKNGAILVFTFVVNLAILVTEAVKRALAILENIQLNGGAIDMAVIADAAARASSTAGNFKFNFALSLTLICWIMGIVDAYYIGKKIDRSEDLMKKVAKGRDN